jgi:hypothetical protein
MVGRLDCPSRGALLGFYSENRRIGWYKQRLRVYDILSDGFIKYSFAIKHILQNFDIEKTAKKTKKTLKNVNPFSDHFQS